jgi:hypothetical protein
VPPADSNLLFPLPIIGSVKSVSQINRFQQSYSGFWNQTEGLSFTAQSLSSQHTSQRRHRRIEVDLVICLMLLISNCMMTKESTKCPLQSAVFKPNEKHEYPIAP